MLSKSFLLACLLFSNSNSVVKGQVTGLPLQNTTIIDNSTTIQQQLNCTVKNEELPEVQSGLNNFVIDMLDNYPFPFAFGQCTSASLLPTSNKRYIYECNTDSNGASTVTKTEYNDANCTGSGSIVDQFSETNVTGAKGYFDCSGSDSYIQIEFSLNSTCQNPVTVYGALGSCSSFINSSSNSLQMNMYCNENEAVMQIFNLMNSLNVSSTFAPFNETLPSLLNNTNSSAFPSTSNQPQSMMCTDDTFCDKWTISNQCKMITSFPLLGNNQTLYGRMVGCITDVLMSTTELMSTTNLNISLTDLNISVTDINVTIGATGGETSSTSTSTSTSTTTSGAIRPSFLFASSVLLLFSFLFSV